MRTNQDKPSGLAPADPAIKHRNISITVTAGDATRQQKAGREMKGIQKERLSDSFKLIRVIEGQTASVRIFAQLQSAFYFQLSAVGCLPAFVCLCKRLDLPASVSLPGCLFAALSSHRLLFYSPEFAAVPPTPQPTDDVDIYFETPADDKEHSRFQRAKEQLEIRHRNRMERVS